jgi:hypothetical protein
MLYLLQHLTYPLPKLPLNNTTLFGRWRKRFNRFYRTVLLNNVVISSLVTKYDPRPSPRQQPFAAVSSFIVGLYGLMLLPCYYHCVVRRAYKIRKRVHKVVSCPVML